MEFKEYKVIKGYYKEKKEKSLFLPEGIHLVYKDGSIGSSGCYTGHNHYLGFIRKSDYDCDIRDLIDKNNDIVDTGTFGDELIYIIISDICPIDELPIYSSDELMKEFELDRYYYITETKRKLNEDKYRELLDKVLGPDRDTVIGNSKSLMSGLDDCFEDSVFCEIAKIVNIEGPCDVTLFDIVNRSTFGDNRPVYSILLMGHQEISKMDPEYHSMFRDSYCYLKKDAVELFNEAKENVLKQSEYGNIWKGKGCCS